ncbi:MAG: T9SS type A sorting domain-containing protein [Cyclobacteriaceae bacterium]|nr:T9SS type A sorting domain-containing protein [Cyclobacteriaceae bacterium]
MAIFYLKRYLFIFMLSISAMAFGQAPGNGMFVAYNSDGNHGFAFVTFVDVPNGTVVRFNDNEWNGLAIGSGGAFNSGESAINWTNSTGNTIFAGTVITITNLNTTPAASIGTMSGGAMTLENDNEVIYMFIGTSATAPTTFITAIANNGFSVANGQLTNTGLTAGTTATAITGGQDITVYNGSINCTGTLTTCATAIATPANWVSQNTGGDDSIGTPPNFPSSVPCNFYGVAFGTVTYYSRNATSGGQWDSNTAWTLSSDGSGGPLATGVWPRRHDNVVIRTGHTIVVNATNDNRSCGVSPDGLGQANIGPFISSNLAMFYHTGDITIAGTLNVTGIEMMTAGYTHVLAGGTFSLGSNLVQVGYLEVDASSTFSSLDDLILTGNSVSIINTNSTSTDDLVIDHTNATLCGTGTATLQNGAGSQVTYTNGGTVNQICTSFTINCTGMGCMGFPVVGTTPVVTGITGPAGVGSSAGDSFLKIWFKVDNGLNTTGTTINSWTNSAGVAALNVSEAGGQRPTLVAGAINGFPEVSFNGSNRLRSGLTLTTSNFVTNQASSFVVNKADNTTQSSSVYLTDPLDVNRFANHIPWSGSVYYDIGNCCGTDARIEVGGLTGLTNYSVWSYDANAATGKQLYRNGTQLQNRAGALTYSSHATHRFNIGGNTTGSAGFEGDITELIIFNARVNQAQRIIIQNYLSAKYAIALSAQDFYTMDNPGNGNFDFEVAGIGQAADGSRHIDAKGSGVVRMWNPNGLSNDEFLIWGHNNASLTSTTSGVDGVIIQERVNRTWRVSETGDVGSVSVSFDISSFSGSPLGANLRLLIDRDGDGFADNDVTPIGAGSFAGNIVTFSGVNFQNGDRFTLGNTNSNASLPIELLSLHASVVRNEVLLQWATATELNNDYFTIQRSQSGEGWEEIGVIKGAGNSQHRIDYQTIDTNPIIGISYYRLKQTDYDGTTTYSSIKRVQVDESYQLKAYPNPTTGKLTVTTGFNIEPHDIRLLNTVGQQIPLHVHQHGSEAEIEAINPPPGIYILQVRKGFWQQSLRIKID